MTQLRIVIVRCGRQSNATAVASALRAYVRYRTTCGGRMHGLIGVIAKPAHWSLTSLPRGLSDTEASRLLSSFVASLLAPRRGYPTVGGALDTGLRSSDLAKLPLADIDWRNGTVTVRRTKSRREERASI